MSLVMTVILLIFCLPVCAFADTSELSDGDEAGISLSTKVPPSVVSGDGAAYTKGGATGLTFTTDDVKGNLSRVLVDGKVVSPENYTVSGDPLAITLHPDFLDTLSAGEHTIEIVTTNGSSFAGFTICNSPTNPNNDSEGDNAADINSTTGRESSPHTGDKSRIDMWIMLMAVSASVLVLLMRKRAHPE